MKPGVKFWQWMWLAATAFNFVIGGAIILARDWSYSLAYGPIDSATGEMALRLWRDFGIFVLLIGVGYYIVARDVSRNHGLAFLGIFAKLFDVVALSYRYATGTANLIVLLPAAIDGIFVLLFIWFFYWLRSNPHQAE